jgi:hypothetical protein
MTYEIQTTNRRRWRLWRYLYRRALPEWFLTEDGWVYGQVVACGFSSRGCFGRSITARAEIKPNEEMGT